MKNEKLIHAIIYFVQNTKNCHKSKLFKLLYFFDLECFKKTGRTPTDLNYFAWKKGPIPSELNEEIENPSSNFKKKIEQKRKSSHSDKISFLLKPKVKFDENIFTENELKELKKVSEKYKNKTGEQMIKISQSSKGLWAKVYDEKKHKQIPFDLILDSPDCKITKEDLEEIKENDEFARKIS